MRRARLPAERSSATPHSHLLCNPVVCDDEIRGAKIRDRRAELVGHDGFETDRARDRTGICRERSVDCGLEEDWLLLAGVTIQLSAERTESTQNRSNDS